MIVDNVREIISFKQSKWLEKYKTFETQKRNQAVDDLEKVFYKLLNIAFYGKTMEDVQKTMEVELINQDDNEKIFEQDSKLKFEGIQKSYTNSDSYTFKQNDDLMDKLLYLGFMILELSKLLMYETFYDD